MKVYSSSLGAGVDNIGAVAQLLNGRSSGFADVPRNTRGHAISLHGSIADGSAVTAVTNRLALVLYRGVRTLPPEITHLTQLWGAVMARAIAGVPANVIALSPPISVDIDLQNHGASKVTRKPGVSEGWGMAAVAAFSPYATLHSFQFFWEMEYLGGSGSKKDIAWVDQYEQE